jgi:hypothetical protein
MGLAKVRIRGERLRGLPDVENKMEQNRTDHVRDGHNALMEKT